MVVARSFQRTVEGRIERGSAFRDEVLTEAVEPLLSCRMELGKALLREVIQATIGFERLAVEPGTSSVRLMSMLAPDGDPTASELFGVIDKAQRVFGVHLHIAMDA